MHLHGQRIRGPWYLRWFWNQRIRGPWYLRWFWNQRIRGPWYLRWFWNQRIRGPWYLRWFWNQRIRGPWCLRCFSSHGSSGCPRRTTCVQQKSTFQPRKLRVSARTTSVLQQSTFRPRKSPAYYVCTTKVEKKRKNTTVLAPRPRENPQRGYDCMSKNVKTRRFWNPQRGYVCMSRSARKRRFWHRDHAKIRRWVTFVCQKHDGFGTAPTPKPAEGCLRPRQKVPKKTVLAPRPGDYPQRVVRGQKETSKNDGFSTATTPKPAEGCPRTERNVKKRRF